MVYFPMVNRRCTGCLNIFKTRNHIIKSRPLEKNTGSYYRSLIFRTMNSICFMNPFSYMSSLRLLLLRVLLCKGLKSVVTVCTEPTALYIRNIVQWFLSCRCFFPSVSTKRTGLGLSRSYDIIKAHGGEMNVNSKEGECAEFIVHLPAF